MPKVLACVDASVYAASVVDHAAWAAGRMGASITILHVIGRKDRGGLSDLSGTLGVDANSNLLQALTEADEVNARLAQERGRALLEAARARLQEHGVTRVDLLHRHGSFVETVCEAEAEADLVVVGKRGANADFARLHLGSNLERVVRAASKPVLVASRGFRDIRRLLLAFDGGPSSWRAVEHLAAKPLFGGFDLDVVTAGADTASSRDALEEAAARLRHRAGAVEARLIPGEPEAVIGNHVRERGIDLLVMGAYGHSRVRSLLVGSTTSAMIRTCLVPVMLFR